MGVAALSGGAGGLLASGRGARCCGWLHQFGGASGFATGLQEVGGGAEEKREGAGWWRGHQGEGAARFRFFFYFRMIENEKGGQKVIGEIFFLFLFNYLFNPNRLTFTYDL